MLTDHVSQKVNDKGGWESPSVFLSSTNWEYRKWRNLAETPKQCILAVFLWQATRLSIIVQASLKWDIVCIMNVISIKTNAKGQIHIQAHKMDCDGMLTSCYRWFPWREVGDFKVLFEAFISCATYLCILWLNKQIKVLHFRISHFIGMKWHMSKKKSHYRYIFCTEKFLCSYS